MSAKDILTEGEIDALMDSVSSGDVPLDAMSGGKSYRPFDFSTREQSTLARMPALRAINEKLALVISQTLQSQFKFAAEVESADARLLKLDEVIAATSQRVGINQIRVSPLTGLSLVLIQGELLSLLVDRFFGGGSGVSAKPQRAELSPTERRINDVLVTRFLQGLADCWKEKIALKPELLAADANRDLLQIASTRDQVVLFGFVIKAGDFKTAIDWVLPYTSLEPLKSRLGSGEPEIKPASNAGWEAQLRQVLLSTDVEVSGLFTTRDVSLSEVLNFRVGAIIPLKMPSDVVFQVEGKPYAAGEHGASNNKKSIKIKAVF